MRLFVFITGCLVILLGGAMLPPAGTPTAEASTPTTPAGSSEARVWAPGDFDVDWAAFADQHRDEYEASSYAAAAAQQSQADREQVRDQMAQEYTQATGAPASDGRADFNIIEPARSGAISQQYYDECDDGSNLPDNGTQATAELLFNEGTNSPTGHTSYSPGHAAPPPQIDLRSMFIVQSTDDNGRFDQTGFLVYACREWTKDNLGHGGITFGLYTSFETSEEEYPTILGDPEAGPDFIVSFFPENNIPERPLQIMAVRTPSRDTSTWTITYLDTAERIDNYEIDGVIPTSAIGDFTADSGFAWSVEVVDTQQPAGGRDWFPERNFLLRIGEGDATEQGTHFPQFPVPEGCGTQEESGNFHLTPQATTPNDDGYPYQWYHPAIRSPLAWDTIRDSSLGGRPRPVTIAVVDTGIDGPLFDFFAQAPRVVTGLDAVYGLELEGGDNAGTLGPFLGDRAVAYESFGATPPPRNSDRGPHGTAVASLIGAHGNNTIGIAGVDWGARLMPIRVNDVNGCIAASDVADGIKWAVDHGADIVHISLSSPDVSTFSGSETPPECGDGIDNDGDDLTDDADPGCINDNDGSEGAANGGSDNATACADGRDNNDPDDQIDGGDPQCESPDDNNESDDSSLVRPSEPLECADGIDNDDDGLVDSDSGSATPDPGCTDADDGSEGPFPGFDLPEEAAACGDGRDNNDVDSVADRDDPECASDEDNNEGQEAETRSVDPLRETIDYALEQGVPVIAAAGNQGSEDDPVVYPAAYPGVWAVGATERSGDRAFYSGTGRWLGGLAPGGNNSGSLGQDLAVLWELDRIRPAAGTSFSAALVTGAASLYLGFNPHITRGFTPAAMPPEPAANFPDVGYQRTVDDVRIALQNASRDMLSRGHDPFSGWGRLDVDLMLDVEAVGGPLIDPARAQLPRTNADTVIEASEEIALSRPQLLPEFITISRSDVAVDALAAAPMLASSPLLASRPYALADSTVAVMHQLLPDGGRVYLLGGEAALGPEVEARVQAEGFEAVRLAGPSRFETAVAIADEVMRLWPGSTRVGVVRADGGDNPTAQWADALSGGAWAAETHTPLVITSREAVHPVVADALSRWGMESSIVFGGDAAISDEVLSALPAAERIAGSSRAETATAIAEELWEGTDGYMLVNGYYARGWVPALAATGWAADENAPLLYTGASDVPSATADLLAHACPDPQTLQIVGGASLVTGTAESALLEAATC